uniref:Integrase catalytic domain-containing protein n=1 Tax=Gasterosteus aculeatus aculeatus TaxID=481459 RepID=A0AAQ4P9U3_GASAC
MCHATRYPAAFPLRTITSKAVVKALTQFISTFGIPKIIQSDRGSNFTSHLFAQVLKQLKVKHNKSTAFHAQSQGALERFHQTLKSLLRSYCTELSADWEEGLPWLLLSAREVVQESTGFSPNDLVFGHKVRGPLAVLQDGCLPEEPPRNLIDYVNGFRLKLYRAGELAKEKLKCSQKKMKLRYDRQSELREFTPGDRVLALLPLVSSPFQAKYCGPFNVLRKVSDLNYLIETPGYRKSFKLCHVNLLKCYHSRDQSKVEGTRVVKSALTAAPVTVSCGLNFVDGGEEESCRVG